VQAKRGKNKRAPAEFGVTSKPARKPGCDETSALRFVMHHTGLTPATMGNFASQLLSCLPNPPDEVKTRIVESFGQIGWDILKARPRPQAQPPLHTQLQWLLTDLQTFFKQRTTAHALENDLRRVSSDLSSSDLQQDSIRVSLRTAATTINTVVKRHDKVDATVRKALHISPQAPRVQILLGGNLIADGSFEDNGVEEDATINVVEGLAWPSRWPKTMEFIASSKNTPQNRGEGQWDGEINAMIQEVSRDTPSPGPNTMLSSEFIEALKLTELTGGHGVPSGLGSLPQCLENGYSWMGVLGSEFVCSLCQEYPTAALVTNDGFANRSLDRHRGGVYGRRNLCGVVGHVYFRVGFKGQYGLYV